MLLKRVRVSPVTPEAWGVGRGARRRTFTPESAGSSPARPTHWRRGHNGTASSSRKRVPGQGCVFDSHRLRLMRWAGSIAVMQRSLKPLSRVQILVGSLARVLAQGDPASDRHAIACGMNGKWCSWEHTAIGLPRSRVRVPPFRPFALAVRWTHNALRTRRLSVRIRSRVHIDPWPNGQGARLLIETVQVRILPDQPAGNSSGDEVGFISRS